MGKVQTNDEPLALAVGTEVSAKYKGAFCEAKVSKVSRLVRCKVTYRTGSGPSTILDEQIVRGNIQVGSIVHVKLSDKKDLLEATIIKLQDCSQYTVVFDDGDIATLRRSALCLKSGRHYSESESLDQLPLTHPEHFGIPVHSRRGRRNQQNKDENSDDEMDDEIDTDLMTLREVIGRVIWVESTDKKKLKDNWFPGVIVSPNAQPSSKINLKEEFLVRSFKDGRFYTVPKKEVNDFTKDSISKHGGNNEATEKALKYLETDEVPVHWDRDALFSIRSYDFDSDDNFSDVDDQEQNEQKDHFVAQLFKFLDDRGTSMNKMASVNNKDVDLYRLFQIVLKFGGYNRVVAKEKWPFITNRLNFPITSKNINAIRHVYKDWLLAYEDFYRKLGCTMTDTPKIFTKKAFSRSLLREKDRVTPVNSPRFSENSADEAVTDKKDDSDDSKNRVGRKVKLKSKLVEPNLQLQQTVPLSVEQGQQVEKFSDNEDEIDVKVEIKSEENLTSASESENQSIELKSPISKKIKEKIADEKVVKSIKSTKDEENSQKIDNEKRRGRKKKQPLMNKAKMYFNIGDEVLVDCRDGKQKEFYKAKILKVDINEQNGNIYYVHYLGWNVRYDCWISPEKIVSRKPLNVSESTNVAFLNTASTSIANTVSVTGITSVTPTTPLASSSFITTTATITATATSVSTITVGATTASTISTNAIVLTSSESFKRIKSVALSPTSNKPVRKAGRKRLQPNIDTQSESDSDSVILASKTKINTEPVMKIRTYQRRNRKQDVKSIDNDDISDNITDNLKKVEKIDKLKKSKIKKSAVKSADEFVTTINNEGLQSSEVVDVIKNEEPDDIKKVEVVDKEEIYCEVAPKEEEKITNDGGADVYEFKEPDSQDLVKSIDDKSKNQSISITPPIVDTLNELQPELSIIELKTEDIKESDVKVKSPVQISVPTTVITSIRSIKVIEERIPIVDLAIKNEIGDELNEFEMCSSPPIERKVENEEQNVVSEENDLQKLAFDDELVQKQKSVKKYSNAEFIDSESNSSLSESELLLEKDSNISNLLCEETFPGSPTPCTSSLLSSSSSSHQIISDCRYEHKLSYKWSELKNADYEEEMPFACTAGNSPQPICHTNRSPQSESQTVTSIMSKYDNHRKSPSSSPEASFSNMNDSQYSPKNVDQNLSDDDDYGENKSKFSPITKTIDDITANLPTGTSIKKLSQLGNTEGCEFNYVANQRKRKVFYKDKDSGNTPKRSRRTDEEILDRNKNYLLNKFYKPPRSLLFDEIDASWSSEQRIEFIRNKMADIREFYQDVKSELTRLDRKKKKMRRREKQAKTKSQSNIALNENDKD